MSIICGGGIDIGLSIGPIYMRVCPCLDILFTWSMQSVASAICSCAHKKPTPKVDEASGIAG